MNRMQPFLGWHSRRLTSLVLLLVLSVIAACSSYHRDAHTTATRQGFVQVITAGSQWQHLVFEGNITNAPTATLHVYIEGDGRPWINGRRPAEDPTPRRALAIELMALDSSPAIYLGRPCYFGLADSPGCEPSLWTSARYSAEVVTSMATVIRHYRTRLGNPRLVLIGYSGGGALAALLAAELGEDIALVTIAGNLDTDAWTQSRGYLPLSESMNPVDRVAVLATTPQLHLVGGRDTIVPPAVTRSFTRHLPEQSTREYPEFDHRCCWVDAWPAILSTIPGA